VEKINLTVNDAIEKVFRKKALQIKGLKRGNLRYAVEDAMILWINTIDNSYKVNSKLRQKRGEKGRVKVVGRKGLKVEMKDKEEEDELYKLTNEEIETLKDIDSGKEKMITYENVDTFLEALHNNKVRATTTK
jgi:hypothetical protein